MSPQDLKDLLPLLRDHRVKRLKLGELELEFEHLSNLLEDTRRLEVPCIFPAEVTPSTPAPAPAAPEPPKAISTEKVESVVVAQGLEEEVPYDDILFHSVPDAPGVSPTPPIPLTGEKPLENSNG